MLDVVNDEERIVRAYHERTKHHLTGFARGPETLDWSSPPAPSRSFQGAPRVSLPLLGQGEALERDLRALRELPEPHAQLEVLAALLELSFGLTAWKEQGPDRWALRANPSSGNLHPTECYVIAQGVLGLRSGLYHYLPFEHALELRAEGESSGSVSPRGLWIATSSIHWREAWKYGERAFRYCLLDSGHALGAVTYAAQALDLEFRVLPCGSSWLKELLGLGRSADFLGVEAEEPEWLGCLRRRGDLSGPSPSIAPGPWHGRASRIDPYPMYKWPQIEVAAAASRVPQGVALPPPSTRRQGGTRSVRSPDVSSVQNIRGRRSAQAYDRKYTLGEEDLLGILAGLAEARPPWPQIFREARVHPVLLVHRVSGLSPGIYALPRTTGGKAALRLVFDERFVWEQVESFPVGLGLYRLMSGDFASEARKFCCGQAIAADSGFVVAFVAEFDAALGQGAFQYRHLHEEAGFLGHVLYLEAEARGLRGTGIGCYFDDPLHQAFGVRGSTLQVVYCFAVGKPIVDSRIQTYPPYPERARVDRGTEAELEQE